MIRRFCSIAELMGIENGTSKTVTISFSTIYQYRHYRSSLNITVKAFIQTQIGIQFDGVSGDRLSLKKQRTNVVRTTSEKNKSPKRTDGQ